MQAPSPPGWYPDPERPGAVRHWTGGAWGPPESWPSPGPAPTPPPRRRRLTGAAVVVGTVLAVVAVGSGLAVARAQDEPRHENVDDFVGGRREVAAVVDRLEGASMATICRELVSQAYRERLGGDDCPDAVDLDADGRAEIEVRTVTITGDTAIASAREGDGAVRVDLVREGGAWRIDHIA